MFTYIQGCLSVCRGVEVGHDWGRPWLSTAIPFHLPLCVINKMLTWEWGFARSSKDYTCLESLLISEKVSTRPSSHRILVNNFVCILWFTFSISLLRVTFNPHLVFFSWVAVIHSIHSTCQNSMGSKHKQIGKKNNSMYQNLLQFIALSDMCHLSIRVTVGKQAQLGLPLH